MMASAREYSHLTDGVRREVVAMIEKAVAQKRKGEGLVDVQDPQCRRFIHGQLEMVRETSYLDGEAERAMTLVSNPNHPAKLELSLGVSVVGVEGQAASKAAKIWGSKAAVGSGEVSGPRSRRRGSDRVERSGSRSTETRTLVLETELVLRARRDASVVVNVTERDADRIRGGRSRSAVQETTSPVTLTAEEIFRESSGKVWVGESDRGHVYCTVKQSCNVDKDFPQYMSDIQLHIYGVSKLQRFT